jgi:hypothetical protein
MISTGRLSLLWLCAGPLLAQSLQITAPASGTTVHPGQSVAVTVSASGAFQQVILGSRAPIGFSQPLSAPPYQFTLQIPANTQPGNYPLTAVGAVTPGNPIYSNAIALVVERTDAPVSVRVQPSLLRLYTVGQKGYLLVIGAFADGTTHDLTKSSLTSFTSDQFVSTVAANGIVTALAPGSGFVNVAYGNLTVQVPVTVDPPLNLAPRQKALYANQTQKFNAQPALGTNPAIVWSINPSGVGAVDNTGLYTAPSSVSSQQIVTITATNAADSSESAGANVILYPPLSIAVAPSAVNLQQSQTQLFAATVSNAILTDVLWYLAPGSPGTLDTFGHYTAPSPVTSQQTVTIQAISVLDGATKGTATVTLIPSTQTAATPAFSPPPGKYTAFPSVTISTATSAASIRYTTDGSTPTETIGTLYTGPITIGSTTKITAIAYASGMADSAVASATYTISPVATPTFSPASGKYTAFPSVTISTATSGASIRYTTDGTTPSETVGTLFTAPFTVSSTTTIKTIAYGSGMIDSAVASATYTISPVETPTFSPAAGKYTSFPAVTISTATSGASIRYTTDGTTPTETAGTLYSGPVTVSSTTTINAIAYGSAMIDSAVASATYTISPVATPTFSPAAGKYTSAQTVTISTATSGASIRYTTDGSTPTETTGTLYSGPVTVSSTTTIKAIAYGSAMIDSAVASATYTITP